MGRKRAESKPDDELDATTPKPAADGAATPKNGTRVMVTLSANAIRLLDTAVLVDASDRSAVVEGLILTGLAGYYSGRRNAEGARVDSQGK